MDATAEPARLKHPFDPARDHLRGGGARGSVSLLLYGDYLCPYCRRIRSILKRLLQVLGPRMTYIFRHFPNERAHPGALLLARAAEAAGRQGKFWEMHDALYERGPPLGLEQVLEIGRGLGLDLARFQRDLDSDEILARIEEDLAEGRRSGVTGTPTIFIGSLRYDGAWDFHSLLEHMSRPVRGRVQQTARAFANLPASAGGVLLAAALAALVAANTALAPFYQRLIETRFTIGLGSANLSLTLADWISEGLLTAFFLVVGLEIRREANGGALADRRSAVLPVVAALGGTIAPALIYLAFNPGPTAAGWPTPTATDIALALGVLAVLGSRASTGLKVFVATFAVVDDILSILVLAIFYPSNLHPVFLLGALAAAVGLAALNWSRIYRIWPYVWVAAGLWLSLHLAGVHPALTGVLLALSLPSRPAPAAGALLGQVATALTDLEGAEKQAQCDGEEGQFTQSPIWEWAARNLSAATERLLSPSERLERGVSPWSSYAILPLFAFSAVGIPLVADFTAPAAPRVLAGVVLGLVLGKPLGIGLAAFAAVRTRLASTPDSVTAQAFLGAACLCGVGDSFSLLLADHAFVGTPYAAVAKIGVLIGSLIAASLGTILLVTSPAPQTPA